MKLSLISFNRKNDKATLTLLNRDTSEQYEITVNGLNPDVGIASISLLFSKSDIDVKITTRNVQ
jgi:hypothetical protein